MVGHGIEGVGAPDLVAEVGPAVEGSFLGLLSPDGDGTAGCFETNAEITREAVEVVVQNPWRWLRIQLFAVREEFSVR